MQDPGVKLLASASAAVIGIGLAIPPGYWLITIRSPISKGNDSFEQVSFASLNDKVRDHNSSPSSIQYPYSTRLS